MDTLEQRAEQIAQEIKAKAYMYDEWEPSFSASIAASLILSALSDARSQAFRDAAHEIMSGDLPWWERSGRIVAARWLNAKADAREEGKRAQTEGLRDVQPESQSLGSAPVAPSGNAWGCDNFTAGVSHGPCGICQGCMRRNVGGVR